MGLDHEGRTIIKPFAPPYYPTMEAAVRAFVDYKFAPGTGFFRDATRPSAWLDPAGIQATIPPYTEENIQAVIGYCTYVMDHYGQFPANFAPIRTLMALPGHHIDTAFYDRFYRPGAYTRAHAEHFERGTGTPDVGPGTTESTRPTRPSWVPNDLYPFEDRWAEIGDLVHYVDEGDGPALLLLHSNPSWSFGWRDVILGLRDRYRCVAPDYPGFGLSRATVGYDFRPRTSLGGGRGAGRPARAPRDRLRVRRAGRSASASPVGGRQPVLGLVIANTCACPTTGCGPASSGRRTGRAAQPAARRAAQPHAPAVPAVEPQARPPDRRRTGRVRGTVPPGARSTTRVLPREIVRGRAYLREVEASLPVLADMPAIILGRTPTLGSTPRSSGDGSCSIRRPRR